MNQISGRGWVHFDVRFQYGVQRCPVVSRSWMQYVVSTRCVCTNNPQNSFKHYLVNPCDVYTRCLHQALTARLLRFRLEISNIEAVWGGRARLRKYSSWNCYVFPRQETRLSQVFIGVPALGTICYWFWMEYTSKCVLISRDLSHVQGCVGTWPGRWKKTSGNTPRPSRSTRIEPCVFFVSFYFSVLAIFGCWFCFLFVFLFIFAFSRLAPIFCDFSLSDFPACCCNCFSGLVSILYGFPRCVDFSGSFVFCIFVWFSCGPVWVVSYLGPVRI